MLFWQSSFALNFPQYKLLKKFFLFFLFLAFALPRAYILPIGFALEFRELAFLMLPVFNILARKENHFLFESVKHRKIKRGIHWFIIVVIFTEFLLKGVLFDQSFDEGIKSMRLGLPLFSGLLLVTQGLNVNVNQAWRTLLLAILTSVLLSFTNFFFPLPFITSLNDEEVQPLFTGRLGNLNFSFGIVGLYLLMTNTSSVYMNGGLVRRSSLAAIVALIGAFNRTYLVILVLEFGVLFSKKYSLKKILKMTLLMSVFFSTLIYLNNNNLVLRNQVEKRFISILSGEISVEESFLVDNRDYIYESIVNRISEGYWITGLPYKTPIFVREARYNRNEMNMSKTDISIVNILLRFGIIPLLILVYVLVTMVKLRFLFFNLTFIFYLLASINIDALFNQNSAFFIFFIFLINTERCKFVK